jgi:hypothetical protein
MRGQGVQIGIVSQHAVLGYRASERLFPDVFLMCIGGEM